LASHLNFKTKKDANLNGSEGVGHLAVAVDVGVHHTMDVLELLGHYQRHLGLSSVRK
jgi:hypothetical protein